jgi:hypothetical protein
MIKHTMALLFKATVVHLVAKEYPKQAKAVAGKGKRNYFFMRLLIA